MTSHPSGRSAQVVSRSAAHPQRRRASRRTLRKWQQLPQLESLELRWLLSAETTYAGAITASYDTAANVTAADAVFQLVQFDDLNSIEDPIAASFMPPNDALGGTSKPFDDTPLPLYPQHVGATDPEHFPLEKLSQEFMVFDNMTFPGKPNLVDDYGFQPMLLYNQFAFWALNEDIFGPPNLDRVRAFANRVDPRQLLVIDIEHLPPDILESSNNFLDKALANELSLEEITRIYVRMVLEQKKGNKKDACKLLNINYRTLMSKLQ